MAKIYCVEEKSKGTFFEAKSKDALFICLHCNLPIQRHLHVRQPEGTLKGQPKLKKARIEEGFKIVPFDATKKWWLFSCINSHYNNPVVLFDPTSVSSTSDTIDIVNGFQQAPHSVLDVIEADAGYTSDYLQELGGHWAIAPANEMLAAKKECMQISRYIILGED